MKKSAFVIALLICTIPVYQNCAKTEFNGTERKIAPTTPPPYVPPYVPPPGAVAGTCSTTISSNFGDSYDCSAPIDCNGHTATFYRAYFTDRNTYQFFLNATCADDPSVPKSIAIENEVRSNRGKVPHVDYDNYFQLSVGGCQSSGTGFFLFVPYGVTKWGTSSTCEYKF